jgi:hypothetical protein
MNPRSRGCGAKTGLCALISLAALSSVPAVAELPSSRKVAPAVTVVSVAA